MTETTSIAATPRDVIGKANRRLKSVGQIPAVLYGGGREAMALAVDRHDFELMMQHSGGGATILKLTVEGEPEPINAMVKDVQTSPIKGSVMHIDFLAIRMDQAIQATAPVHFLGDAPGVREGGIFLHDLREFSVEALPKDLPEAIEVDISGLELNHSITVAEVVAPEGVTILDDPDTTVCSVTVPSAEPVEEEELEEELEPEVIGEEEEEEAAAEESAE